MKSNLIIGTAGHVDHGKTTLIRALTQTDPDRLKEEKQRGISIDLGFAPLHLPSGRLVGIIDVPGHERYLKNMLAGAGNLDLVILTIAADEGVRPQTKEHLDILKFLNVQGGITVITKIDLVDPDWLELVTEEVKTAIQDSFLAEQPILPVSAVTGQGLSQLVNCLDSLINNLEPKELIHPARLPVDRVFTVPGFGTVVTGTLIAGQLRTDQILEILPGEKSARIRQIQVFGEKTDCVRSGQRVALNLANIGSSEVKRGQILAEPGKFKSSDLIDLRIQLLNDLEKGIANRTRIRFYHCTAEILGRITLLERDQLEPGQSGLAQIILEQPIAAAFGDRFVVRTYSPQTTIGGGMIINPNPSRRHRRKKKSVLQELSERERGTPRELINSQLLRADWEDLSQERLRFKTGLVPLELEKILTKLELNGQVLKLLVGQTQFYLHKSRIDSILTRLLNKLAEEHQKHSLARGLKKEQLKSVLGEKISQKMFEQLLLYYEQENRIKIDGPFVSLPEFTPCLTSVQEEIKAKLQNLYLLSAYRPPEPRSALTMIGGEQEETEKVFNFLIEQGELVKLGNGIVFHRQLLETAQKTVCDFLVQQEEISLAKLRDLLKTSRKYALSLAEYFDQIKLTRRIGDKRVLFRTQGTNFSQ